MIINCKIRAKSTSKQENRLQQFYMVKRHATTLKPHTSFLINGWKIHNKCNLCLSNVFQTTPNHRT